MKNILKSYFLKTVFAGLIIAGLDHASIAAIGDGSLSDTNIKYFGRWDRSNASEYYGYWGGAYIRVVFTGTSIKINLGNTLTYYAEIDNNPWFKFTAVRGINNLSPVPLAQGSHTLVVAQGRDYAYEFDFKGLVLDAGAETSQPPSRIDLIEWIGDSITDGYTDSMSDVSDYAWVCAESLNCEHVQIAYPGIALVDGYGVNANKTGMCTQYFKLQDISYANSVTWNFSDYIPKVVVINIGTNDGQTPNDLYQSTYVTFLTNIRAKLPQADIIVLVPHAGSKQTQDSLAYLARVAAGDEKVHYINSNGWLKSSDENDGLHPSNSGQIKYAGLLKPLISRYLTPPSSILPAVVVQSPGLGKARLLGICSNPPGRTVRVAYSLPKNYSNISTVVFAAYDCSGKLAWKESVSEELHEGTNAFVTANRSVLSGGIYVIQMTTKYKNRNHEDILSRGFPIVQ